MPPRHRRALGILLTLALATVHLVLTATRGYAATATAVGVEDPTPSPTGAATGQFGLPPFDPVTYGMWGLSAIIAVAAIFYAMERERRKG
ncbi:MAG: hypothetical protein V9F82_13945 [Dermatophilaceae bacterium]